MRRILPPNASSAKDPAMLNQALLIGSLLAAAGAAQADLLYSQPWDGSATVFASQNDPTNFGNYATSYDDFQLASASTLTGIDFVGAFFNPGNVAPIGGVTVTLYADAGGAPGASIANGYFAFDANGTYLASPNGIPHYRYSLPFKPYAIDPGTYWMSVVADVNYPPQWGLATSAAGTGNAWQDLFGTRSQLTGTNLAFDLEGTSAAPVPEPGGWALMLAGGIGLGLARRRRAALSPPSSPSP